MSLLKQYAEDMKNANESGDLLVPPGTYQAVLTKAEDDEVNNRTYLTFTLQNNPGLLMPDDTPVDGVEVRATLFWPNPEDKAHPAKNGRGTKFDTKLRMCMRVVKALGLEPGDEWENAYGIPVLLDIQHETYEGELRERVQRIKPIA